MCGIIGYAGKKQSAPILLDGLKKLEYRGYDSAGLAVCDNEFINVKKSKGRLSELSKLTDGGNMVKGVVGIGHTRWATHGEPSDANSHPHLSSSGRFAIVHNGIIENYIHLKNMLTSHGITFESETDSEVVAHLFEYYYNGDSVETLIKVVNKLEGSYALGIISAQNSHEILAITKNSPLIVAFGKGENFISSDVTAILKYTNKVSYLNDDEIAVVSDNNVQFFNLLNEKINKKTVVVDIDPIASETDGYEHFMLKEIYQQPLVISKTIKSYIKNGRIVFDSVNLTELQIKNIKKIRIIACGTSYHVGLTGKYVIESLCRVPVEVSIASEFRYSNPILDDNELAIFISQSGETADTLAALKEAKLKGVNIMSIVNVIESSIAKLSENLILTHAGPEIAVASTKAYSAQLIVLYMLAVFIGQNKGKLSNSAYNKYVDELIKIPSLIEEILNDKEKIKDLAFRFYNCKSAFFIGRNLDYTVCLEASLKLKEISYIHSEGYAAGELKHGTISLIEKGTLVIAVATIDSIFEKTISNIKEVEARGATVIRVVKKSDKNDSDNLITLPITLDLFMPSLSIIPLQLFAYYCAYFRGCDIDKPRNLAKSVTVE